jgi:multidrug efflux pump subunit AcrA (membrane-fusion protein)
MRHAGRPARGGFIVNLSRRILRDMSLAIGLLAALLLVGWLVIKRSRNAKSNWQLASVDASPIDALEYPGQNPSAAGPAGAARDDQQPIYAAGRLEGATREVLLRSAIVERVQRVLVVEGDRVSRGTPLLELDGQTASANLALSQARLDEAKADQRRLLEGARPSELDAAQKDMEARWLDAQRAARAYERSYGLSQHGAVSQQDLDDHATRAATTQAAHQAAQARYRSLADPPREEDVDRAEAIAQAAQAQHAAAARAVRETTIVAPSDCQILRVHAQVGEVASPEDLEPLLIVCDTSQWRVRIEVEEYDAAHVSVGQQAIVTSDGLPGLRIPGCITQLSRHLRAKRLRTNQPAEELDANIREAWIDLDLSRFDPSLAEQLVVGLPMEATILTSHESAELAQGAGNNASFNK